MSSVSYLASSLSQSLKKHCPDMYKSPRVAEQRAGESHKAAQEKKRLLNIEADRLERKRKNLITLRSDDPDALTPEEFHAMKTGHS